MRLRYCCKFPNQSLFMDGHGNRETAVVFCNSCRRIAAEIWLSGELKGKSLFGEEE